MGIIYTNTKPSYAEPPLFFKKSLVAMAVFVALAAKRQGGAE